MSERFKLLSNILVTDCRSYKKINLPKGIVIRKTKRVICGYKMRVYLTFYTYLEYIVNHEQIDNKTRYIGNPKNISDIKDELRLNNELISENESNNNIIPNSLIL